MDDADELRCTVCDEELDAGALSCAWCAAPTDAAAPGICAFCAVATDERCGGCGALICIECSDEARTGRSAASDGQPWCPDCRTGAGAGP